MFSFSGQVLAQEQEQLYRIVLTNTMGATGKTDRCVSISVALAAIETTMKENPANDITYSLEACDVTVYNYKIKWEDVKMHSLDTNNSVSIAPTWKENHFNKTDKFLLATHIGAVLFDGFSTKHWEHNCLTCIERVPFSRALLGRRPTWNRMVPLGAAEVGLSFILPKSIRRYIQVSFIAGHTGAGIYNYKTF